MTGDGQIFSLGEMLRGFSAQACNDQKDQLRPLHSINKDCSEPELAVKLVSV